MSQLHRIHSFHWMGHVVEHVACHGVNFDLSSLAALSLAVAFALTARH